MTIPPISVIIPVYDRFEELKRALSSVLVQTYQNFEILIVDDASPIPIPKNISTDKRTKLIRLPTNQGAAAARNEGIRNAVGTYIAFLDSDDTWDPEYLETQMRFLKDLPSSYGGAVTGFRLVSSSPERSFLPSFPEDLFLYFLGGCFISPGSALIVKKDVFKDIGFFDTFLRRLEDWEWLLRFSKQYALFPIPEMLVTIYNNESPPSSFIINQSLKKVKELAIPILKDYPPSYKRRFLAALELEKASAAKRNKLYLLSFLSLLKGAFYDFRYVRKRICIVFSHNK